MEPHEYKGTFGQIRDENAKSNADKEKWANGHYKHKLMGRRDGGVWRYDTASMDKISQMHLDGTDPAFTTLMYRLMDVEPPRIEPPRIPLAYPAPIVHTID